MDILYFGYDFPDESAENRKNEKDFIKEIKEKFPNVVLLDVYNDIKGFRQQVSNLDEIGKDNYYSWLFGAGWFEFSLTMQLMQMDKEKHAEVYKYLDLAKEQYPNSFKK
jgi:CRISPR/Cas system CSM-associated protein Csm5 (group 7 of RAMP superfamily)